MSDRTAPRSAAEAGSGRPDRPADPKPGESAFREADSEQWRQFDERMRQASDFARVLTEAQRPQEETVTDTHPTVTTEQVRAARRTADAGIDIDWSDPEQGWCIKFLTALGIEVTR